MRTDFIYIDDTSQIDTSKTTVYDLNKRYVDSKGNLYGLKYNRQSRKVEVVRLLRTTSDRAGTIRSRMIENRRANMSAQNVQENREDVPPADGDEEYTADQHIEDSQSVPFTTEADEDSPANLPAGEADTSDYTFPDTEPFLPDRLVQQLFEAVKLHKERFSTINSNINKAQVITHQDRQKHNDFEDLKRTLEIEAYKKIDEISTIQKELLEYPRPVSYYIPRLSRSAQKMLQSISNEKSKIRFILFCEINDFFRETYKIFLTVLDRYQELITRAENTDDRIKASQRKQFLADALTTLSNTRLDVHGILSKLRMLDEYLKNPKNFTS